MRPVLPQITGVRKPSLIGPEASGRMATPSGSRTRYLNSNLDSLNSSLGSLGNLIIMAKFSAFRSG